MHINQNAAKGPALEIGGAEDLLRVAGSCVVVEYGKAEAPVLAVKVLGHEQLGLDHACMPAAVSGVGPAVLDLLW